MMGKRKRGKGAWSDDITGTADPARGEARASRDSDARAQRQSPLSAGRNRRARTAARAKESGGGRARSVRWLATPRPTPTTANTTQCRGGCRSLHLI